MSEAKTETEKPYLRWDTCDVIQQQANLLVEEAAEAGEPITEEDAYERASEDPFLINDEWEELLDILWDDVLEVINPGRWWKGEVRNFGWQKLNGHCPPFKADDAATFLRKILPDCDCTFNIYLDEDKREIRLRNWHHDSPCGDENYTIVPCSQDEEE